VSDQVTAVLVCVQTCVCVQADNNSLQVMLPCLSRHRPEPQSPTPTITPTITATKDHRQILIAHSHTQPRLWPPAYQPQLLRLPFLVRTLLTVPCHNLGLLLCTDSLAACVASTHTHLHVLNTYLL